ncbi:MAG: hypothetical protein L6R38_004054 [Xanthoria sp. 2 TBL-2021]|nr:MAG: hypothetical protein L6R38_004054 [Xanthoria sp. 2 TBL-2021]
MARPHIAAALAVACLGILVTFHLISQFGLPSVGFFYFQQSPPEATASPNQVPLGPTASRQVKSEDDGSMYLLGTGKADITGPVVEINLMGYADPNQVGSGLRQRLYSRAFIVGDIDKEEERTLYLVLDTQSGDTAVRHGILEGLKELGPEYQVYGKSNVAVTGTHSHSGPGAWLNYLLPQITSKGFDAQSYRAIVDGALLSVKKAHEALAPGYLTVAETKIHDANINRSLYAYLANPEKERAKYQDDVDKILTMLRFRRAEDGKDMGVLTWFPVHGTSMLGNNTLISGDNKGVAAMLFEKDMQSQGEGTEDFVAGFSQANVGDTSPNVLGAYCEDGSGEKCNFQDSTCGKGNKMCHGRGPMFRQKDQGASSCLEIGRRQYVGAKALYLSMTTNNVPIKGPVRSFHTYRDFSNMTIQHPNGSLISTCPAALGYSFAAGTTDGPGAFDFKQNDTGAPDANPLWSVVRNLLREPSESQKACHAPKPILLDVGEIERPYLWTPNIVDIQVFRIGQLLIVVSPGEATTMAGRRWKESISHTASALALTSEADDENPPIVVLGGPANSYTHYIATEEEYNIQRYEGASTLYGPHTLNAYISITTSLLTYLQTSSHDKHPPPGPDPPIHTNVSFNFNSKVHFDSPPFFKKFGQVLKDVEPAYHRGGTVSATFVGANPRNNLRLEGTFAAVEHLSHGSWKRVRDDTDWDLIYRWRRTSTILGTSEVELSWEVGRDDGVEGGLYRFRYFGDRKPFGGGEIEAFEGESGVCRIE